MRQLIELGLAYADDTPADLMKEQRDAGIESVYRQATVEENLERFKFMLETR
jgi:glutamyl-tRNA synthetase